MTEVAVERGGRVRGRFEVPLPLARSTAWITLADFERIVCLDHFHTSADLGGRRPRPGLAFDLPHRVLGRRLERRGRILRWEEGVGYAFSDLATRRELEIFAHVFQLRLDDEDDRSAGCRLVLEIRGLWTVSWLPRWATRVWLAWNLDSMGQRIRRAILADALRAARAADSSSRPAEARPGSSAPRISRTTAGCSAGWSAARETADRQK